MYCRMPLQALPGTEYAKVVVGTGRLRVVTSLPLLLIGSTTVRDGRGSAIAKTLRAGVVTF